MFLKIVETEGSPIGSDNAHSVWADIVSVHFERYEDGSGAQARCYVRDPIKTGQVPGFVEHERHLTFTGVAYLMNDDGKTISSFTAQTSARLAGVSVPETELVAGSLRGRCAA